MSSKYDFEDTVFLTNFYSCWRAENWHTTHKSHIIVTHDIKVTQSSKYKLSKNQCPQTWLQRLGVVDNLLFMQESQQLAHKSRIAYKCDPWCQEWSHFLSIQSGTTNVLKVWPYTWCTSNQIGEPKIGIKLNNVI